MKNMREFILLSRRGRTDASFPCLREAGRLDVVYQCILSGLFLSGAIRRDVVLHAVLNGPPKPPLHLAVDGERLSDVRTDERTWENILRKVLSGGNHPGVTLAKESLEQLVKEREGRSVFVLEEKGKDISEVTLGTNPVFVLGDQVGLPKKTEKFVQRYGAKISLGKRRYLAGTCVDIINYLIDTRSV